MPVELKIRDKENIVHGCRRREDKPGLIIGIPMSTMCLRLFVTKHWKGNKHFRERQDVESMRVVDLPVNCMTCIAREETTDGA